MTDMDSSLLEGNGGSPNAPASNGGVQRGSETVAIPKADWDNLQKKIQRLEDDTRSNKDRAVKHTNERMDKFEQDYGSVLERVTSLMSDGKTRAEALKIVKSEEDDAESKQAILEFAKAWKSGNLPVPSSPGSGNGIGGKVAAVVQEFELDENSPEIVDIYKQFGDTYEAERAVLRLAAKRQTQPSAGMSTAVQGKPLKSDSVEKLTRDYQKEMIAARGNKALGRETKEKFRKAGVPVDSVEFSV